MPSLVHSAAAAAAAWRTPFTDLFGCTLPILGAPMAGVSGGLLAAETCRAGGVGFLAAGHATDEAALASQVALFHDATAAARATEGTTIPTPVAWGLGFITHSSCRNGDLERLDRILGQHKPPAVQFFAPAVVAASSKTTTITTNIDVAHAHGALVLAQVGTVADARQALDAGVDALLAQGSEAGGHGLRNSVGCGTLPLAARLASIARQYHNDSTKNHTTANTTTTTTAGTTTSTRTKIPVLAAGGMVDGHSLAAALALGCDGMVLGTRLWASHEALGRSAHKDLLAETRTDLDDCVRTTVHDRIQKSYSSTPWPYPYDSVGVLRNAVSRRWEQQDGRSEEAAARLEATRMTNPDVAAAYRAALARGDAENGCVYAGQGVGAIESIEHAYDILQGISVDAARIVRDMPSVLVDP